MIITLGRFVEDQRILREGQPDIGKLPTFETFLRPEAVMWLNEGTAKDKKKAEEYAAKEGYRVFTPPDNSDPLVWTRKALIGEVRQNYEPKGESK